MVGGYLGSWEVTSSFVEPILLVKNAVRVRCCPRLNAFQEVERDRSLTMKSYIHHTSVRLCATNSTGLVFLRRNLPLENITL